MKLIFHKLYLVEIVKLEKAKDDDTNSEKPGLEVLELIWIFHRELQSYAHCFHTHNL